MPRLLRGLALIAALLLSLPATPAAEFYHFAILGDRTGEAQPSVYEQVWQEIAAGKPAFVVSVGDTIQGGNDETAAAEWRHVENILDHYRTIPLYLTPGNHDVWSAASERLFLRYEKRGLHYSFDYKNAHFTILDNSRSDELSPGELAFLESDLRSHAAQPLKFIVSHRPSWLVGVALRNAELPLHKLAKQYGVRYVIAGHVHQMMRLELDGITYISAPSSGGHLRASVAYEDGWFFGHIAVRVDGDTAEFQIKEAAEPHGKGRTSKLSDWGMLGRAKPALQ